MKHPIASSRPRARLAVAGATVGLATAVPGVYAQETSATVRGAVSTSSGEALAGATVIVTSTAPVSVKPSPLTTRLLPARAPSGHDIVVDANGWQKALLLVSSRGLSEVINYRFDAEEEVIVMALGLQTPRWGPTLCLIWPRFRTRRQSTGTSTILSSRTLGSGSVPRRCRRRAITALTRL